MSESLPITQRLFQTTDWLGLPAYLGPSSWTGHTAFAMYIVATIQPKLLVELGTHYGTSYCAFCEALDRLSSNARAVAIDTWEGDDQAYHYGPEVLEELKAEHDPKYASFSSLMQMTFDEAVDKFEDGSIDLLHIDGLHTYEAVKHDFETWLPKLSDRAIVLLHDTNEHMQDFGVWQFFAEISQTYPSFEFLHEHGLGMVAVGSNIPAGIRYLFDLNETDTNFVRATFEAVGMRNAMTALYERTAQERDMIAEESAKRQQVIQNNATVLTNLQNAHTELRDTYAKLQGAYSLLEGETQRVLERLNILRADKSQLEKRSQQYEQLMLEKQAEVQVLQNKIEELNIALQTVLNISRQNRAASDTSSLSSESNAEAMTAFTKRISQAFADASHPSITRAITSNSQRILIIIPYAVNYFYRLLGTRLTEALRNNGHKVELSHLHIDHNPTSYDWVFHINPYEILQGYTLFNRQGTASDAEKRIATLNAGVSQSAMVLIESAGTPWFAVSYDLFTRLGMDVMFDIGLHTQEHLIPAALVPKYHFVFNGLTTSEKQKLSDRVAENSAGRLIDWAFVGTGTSERLDLLDRLRSGFSANGFVYVMSKERLEALTPESSHIQHREFQIIQEMSQYIIWCAHHSHFYMEPQRFREAALAGALPIKVLLNPDDHQNLTIPFANLLINNNNAIEAISQINYKNALNQFQQEFLALPLLEETIQQALLKASTKRKV